MPPTESGPAPKRGLRWWPAAAILVCALIAYVVVWFVPHRSQQHFNLAVAQIIMISFLALLLWALLFSRLRGRVRLGIFALTIALLALVVAGFRIGGVTGNLVPILELRWAHRVLPAPTSAEASHASPALAGAADFPQFLGPHRNATLGGPLLDTNWSAHPPALLWRQPVGAAWSGFVVSGSIAVTQEQREEEEFVVARDLITGRILWSHADRTRYFTTLAGEGPRASPTIADGRVFSQGATGRLNCLELATGRVIWTKDIFQENEGHLPGWGYASSPLALDDVVVVNAGGHQDRSLVAYHAADGSFAWAGGKQGAGYSSPLLATLDDVKQIVVFGAAVVGHDATSGKPLWSFPWPGGHPHIAMPVIVNGTDLIVSSGYGTGSGRVHIARDASGQWSAKPVWRTNRMKAKFANPVLYRGCVYGLDDGIMACLDAETGGLRWKDGRYGHGQVLLVGQLLLVMAEDGSVLLLDPQPDRLRELTRFTALTSKTWNPPALAGEYLLVRNDKEAACFRLPVVK